jgi:hypothetical protein
MADETRAIEERLHRALLHSVEIHTDRPAKYYFGAGDRTQSLQCREVLKLLRALAPARSPAFFSSPKPLPVHPHFHLIRPHIAQIAAAYGGETPLLIRLFMRKLAPPPPLRHSVLSQISIYAARVFLHSDAVAPAPLSGYIDGYFDFVVPVGADHLRVPLIPPPAPPPKLRFVGKNEEPRMGATESNKKTEAFILSVAPKTGRQSQLHAFIAVLNAREPVSDFLPSFANALASPDASFATAICVLASDQNNLVTLRNLVNILAARERLDHFLRCLSVTVSLIALNDEVRECPEVFALSNLFMASSGQWAHEVANRCPEDVEKIIVTICDGMNLLTSAEATYILKAMLVMAAYADVTGCVAIALFLEIVGRPFISFTSLGASFLPLKQRLLRGDADLDWLRTKIEDAILMLMSQRVSIAVRPDSEEEQLFEIHNFVSQKLEDFVRLVIILNGGDNGAHPLVRALEFVYTRQS